MRLDSYRDLRIWREAHALTLMVYRASDGFPDRERFGVTGQLRRAAASVPANIAEGMGRRGTKELVNFLSIARGSLLETTYFVVLASDLGYLDSALRTELEQRYRGLDAGIHACMKQLSKK